MQRHFIFLLCFAALASCKSPQQKAAAAIEAHLSKTMDDPKSYEAVETSKLDSVFYERNEDPRVKASMDSLRALSDTISGIRSRISTLEQELEMGTTGDIAGKRDSIDLLDAKYHEVVVLTYNMLTQTSARFKSMPRKLKGFNVIHSYRAKNKMDGVQLYKQEFLLSEDLSKVLSAKETESK